MSWATCYSGSNNIHFDFPPIMNDGRNYATWQPGAVINEQIRKDAGIKTNNEYRQYMMNNAEEIIKTNQINACDQTCGTLPFYGRMDSNQPSGTPYVFKSCLDNSRPFGYEDSDLKNVYLTKNQLQARMVAPMLTQDQYLRLGLPNPN
jgi:hypothetical protein